MANHLDNLIAHHHVGSELFSFLSAMVDRVKTGNLGEHRSTLRAILRFHAAGQ